MSQEYYPSGSQSDVHDADQLENNAGACEPIIIRYRIFPAIDFGQVFGQPPVTVITE